MWWRSAQYFVIASCGSTIDVDVCIWRMFLSVVVTVWGFVVYQLCFSLGVLKYVVYLCGASDGCYVFCLYCEAWSCRCSCMGSVSVSSCR